MKTKRFTESLLASVKNLSSARYVRNPHVFDAIVRHTTQASHAKIRVMDITSEPAVEVMFWQECFANAEISSIYAKPLRSATPAFPPDTLTSATFGSQFWDDVAASSSPHLLVSDGTLGHYHQKELFDYLFPVLEPGGIFVLEHDRSEDHHVLLDHLEKVVSAGFLAQGDLSNRTDFLGYCARNIEAIEFIAGAVIVRKRKFDQRKFVAMPLGEIASETSTLDAPTAYLRTTPRVFGSKTIKQRTLNLLDAFKDVVPPAAQIGRLTDAVVIEGGIVYTLDGRIVEESFINVSHVPRRGPFFRVGKGNLYVSEVPIEPRAILSQHERVIVKQTWDSNYGHWLVDTLPRVSNVLEVIEDAPIRYLLNGAASPEIQTLHSESLALLGVAKDSIDFVDRRPTLVENAIYATPMTKPPFVKSHRAISILEELARMINREADNGLEYASKIYITRNKYPRRNLLNEELVLPYIRQAGYEVIVPEKLSLKEQILTFASATHVIGNMGAAFSNLSFSPPGVKVLMLATELMVHDYFLDIVSHKRGEYWALQGVATDSSAGIGSDFTIDLEQFKSVFEQFIQE